MPTPRTRRHTTIHPTLSLALHGRSLGNGLSLCLTVAHSFSLTETAEDGRPLPLAPEQGWISAAKSVADGCPVDLGCPKPRAEWLMAGSAHAPSGTTLPGLTVEVRVGNSGRRFYVCGDRVDDDLGNTAPVPFASMPLDWGHTRAGEENPLGMGEADAAGVRRLPNVIEESLSGDIAGDAPACPQSMSPEFRRLSATGTYDADWLRTLWPAPPRDFDWTLFNLAQTPQRLEGFFTGLEEARITNMHPDRPVLSFSLPGLRVRCFADYGTEDEPDWRELETVADTLWLFPNALAGMQLWHAVAPVRDEAGTDIRALFVSHEDAAGPRHTLAELVEAFPAPERGAEEVVAAQPAAEPQAAEAPAPAGPPVEEPPLPETPDPPVPPKTEPLPPEPPSPAELLQRTLDDAKADIPDMLAAVNPVLTRMNLPPVTAESVEAMLDAQGDALRSLLEKSATPLEPEEILRDAGFSEKRIAGFTEALTLTPPARSAFLTEEDYEEAVRLFGERFQTLTDAPDSVREQLVAFTRATDPAASEDADAGLSALFAKFGPDMPETGDAGLADTLAKAGIQADMPALTQALEEAGRIGPGSGTAAMDSSLRALALALNLDPDESSGVFAGMIARLRATLYSSPEIRGSLEGLAKAHPQLGEALPHLKSALDGVALMSASPADDLRALAARAGVTDEAALEAVAAVDPLPTNGEPLPEDPEPAPEGNSDASGGDSAGSGTKAADASESPAPGIHTETDPFLGEPREEGDVFPEDTGHASEGHSGEDSGLPPDMGGRDLAGAVLAGRSLPGRAFDGADLRDADLRGCDLRGSTFAHACLAGAHLTGARLEGCDFTNCDLTRAVLADADARDAVFDGALFAATDLDGMRADRASFKNARAHGQDFSRCASLRGADFEAAGLARCRFDAQPLDRASFVNCDLADASFAGCSMKNARFVDCGLDGTDFRRARLADSSFLRCEGRGVSFDDALLTLATFEGCSFLRSSLARLDGRFCRFLSCDLRGGDLRGSDLFEGALRDCRVGGCDLSHASLWGADLLYLAADADTTFEGCDLGGTVLTPRDASGNRA